MLEREGVMTEIEWSVSDGFDMLRFQVMSLTNISPEQQRFVLKKVAFEHVYVFGAVAGLA